MSRALKIRDAVPDDADHLDALHRRSSFVWEEDRPSLEANPDALGVERAAIAEGRVRVAMDAAGGILGFATVSATEHGDCELDDLFVDPSGMRRGIGRELVEDAAARAKLAGHASMTVVAHSRNFPFYEAVGFVVVGSAQTRFGPAHVLRRHL